jgi:transcription elongation GreA/GreB family factor
MPAAATGVGAGVGRGVVCYIDPMTTSAKQLLERVASWPEEDIEKLEEAARQIEAWRNGEYHATEEELRAIDEAIAELDRGEVASEAQVRAAYAKFRSA